MIQRVRISTNLCIRKDITLKVIKVVDLIPFVFGFFR